MIRMAQIGIDSPHAAAYRHTLALFPDRIEVVGLVNTRPEREPVDLGPLNEVPVFDSVEQLLDTVDHGALKQVEGERLSR